MRMILPALAVLLPLASAAQTDDATLLRCAAMTDAALRLACYDALGQQARSRAASAATEQQRRTADFGLPPKPDPNELQAVQTHLPGPFNGWSAKQRFTLANGQVWEISDDSSAFGRGNDVKVTVRRGSLGSFFIDFEGVTRSPRVKRVE